MIKFSVTRMARSVVVAACAAAAVLGVAAPARAAEPVLTFQQYLSGSASYRVSSTFTAAASTLWIGMRCAPGGSATTGSVTLWDETTNEPILQSDYYACDGRVWRYPYTIAHATSHTFSLVWMSSGGSAPSQSVYAWR